MAVQTVALARAAMNTRFEIVLHGRDATSLRAAGEEALDEIERLEDQLSLYRPTSEVAHLNARAAREAVRVEPRLFRLLEHAQRLHRESGGTFDLTIAPLMRCWGFTGDTGKRPRADDLAAARRNVGMHLVQLDAAEFTVRFLREGVMLDFGAIGKGYAIERSVQLLRDAGVESALLHGGTSSIYALGHPPGADAWKIALEYPDEPVPPTTAHATSEARDAAPGAVVRGRRISAEAEAPRRLLAVVPLCDESLSVSAVWGKSFQAGGKTFGHVLDPRTGRPASRALLAAVVLPSATEADALSTALLAVGIGGHAALLRAWPKMRMVVLEGERRASFYRTCAKGIRLRALPRARFPRQKRR